MTKYQVQQPCWCKALALALLPNRRNVIKNKSSRHNYKNINKKSLLNSELEQCQNQRASDSVKVESKE